MNHAMVQHPYRRLLFMAILSFLSMYGLMYMMVDRLQNVVSNVNQLYMAGMMTAIMIVLELALMGAMYPSKNANAALIGVSMVFGILFIMGIRMQALVDDAQFIKSMIPHHAAAILMCNEARIQDAEIQELCRSIVKSQQAEIDWMHAKQKQQRQ